MRVFGTTAPRISTPPDSQSGATTLTAGAPKMSRATCCRISPTPNVTSRVSSGRWYIRWMSVHLEQHAHRAADDEADEQRNDQRPPVLEITCCTT